MFLLRVLHKRVAVILYYGVSVAMEVHTAIITPLVCILILEHVHPCGIMFVRIVQLNITVVHVAVLIVHVQQEVVLVDVIITYARNVQVVLRNLVLLLIVVQEKRHVLLLGLGDPA